MEVNSSRSLSKWKMGNWIFILFILLSQSAVAKESVRINFLGEKDRTIKGVYVQHDYWFNLSPQWKFTKEADLELRFSHSPILVKRLSTLTVEVNEKPVHSIYLDETNVSEAVLKVKIPARYLKDGMNLLSFILKMRSDKELCDDVHNPALWTIFEKESSLTVYFEEIDIIPDLALFPESYANPDLIYGKLKERVHAIFVLPKKPSQVVLDSSAVLSAVLGDALDMNLGYFKVVTSPEEARKYHRSNVVVIGNYDFVKGLSATPLNTPLNLDLYAGDKNGRIFELQSPLNPKRRMLVITGRDDQAINLVKENLKRPTRLIGLKGNSVIFSDVPLSPIPPAVKNEAVFAIRLKDLKMSDQIARGKFYHSINFTMPNPFVGKIKDGAFLRLHMSHSELLLPQTSSLLVKVNGNAVRSIRLTPETATRQHWDVLIPVVYLNSRFLMFELEIFMDIGDPDCMFNHPEMAWFTLHNDTLLYQPIDIATPVTLSNYPHVFMLWNRLENITLLIDPTIFETTMTAAINISAYLSNNLLSAEVITPSIKTLDTVDDALLKGENIISIAIVDRLMSDKNFGVHLPKELTTGGWGGARGIHDGSSAMNSGFLNIKQSPWSREKWVLISTGGNEKDVKLSSSYLYESGKSEWIRGILLALYHDGHMKVILPPADELALLDFDPSQLHYVEKGEKKMPVIEVPKPATPPAKHNVAYLLFFLFLPIIILLVILRLKSFKK